MGRLPSTWSSVGMLTNRSNPSSTNKHMKKKIKNTVDAELVEAWMGSEATLSDYAQMIADLANGDYKPSDCRNEVNDYKSIND